MTAYAEMLIQDAPDGPGPLTPANDGQFLVWNGQQRRFEAATLRMTGGGAVRAMASRIQDAPDGPGGLGSGDDGKALVWNSSTGRFVMTAVESAGAAAAAIVAHVAVADPHTGYLLATGSRTGASSQAQTFTNGVITGKVRPPSDSTTAFVVRDAGDSNSLLVGDTTNLRVGIRTTPATTLHVYAGATNAAQGLAVDQGGANSGRLFFPVAGGSGGAIYYLGSEAGLTFNTGATPGSASGTSRMFVGGANGYVQIGGTAPVSRLHVTDTITTSDAASRISQQLDSTVTLSTAGTSQQIRGAQFKQAVVQNDGTNKLQNIAGALFISELTSGSGNVGTIYGFQAVARINGGGGTVDNAYTIYAIGNMKPSGSGTVTNGYGVYIEDVTNAGTAYGLYQSGSDDLNYFAAKTGFGVTAPTAMVHAAASTAARASLCLPHGSAPTNPVNGDMWTTTAGLFVRINGTTIGPLT